MAFQDTVEAISATSTTTAVTTATTTATTTTAVTNAFSVDALADVDPIAGNVVTAPSNTVVDLDGKLFKILIAGTIPTSPDVKISVNATNFLTVHNISGSSVLPFFVEITAVWFAATGKLVFAVGDQSSGSVGYTVLGVDGVETSLSAQSDLVFEVDHATTITQLTMKLA